MVSVDLDALRGSPVGQLVPISGQDARYGDYDYFAFLPKPLPERIELDAHSWTTVAHATEALGRLKQACAQLPNPQLLIAPALAREAIDTSALEGTYATLGDLLEARLPLSVPKSPQVAEIRAYEQMARQAFAWVAERPVTIGMLCELQGILARDSRMPARDPGKIREHQVLIGPEDCRIEDARYVPPPPDDRLRSALDNWQAWIDQPHDLPIPVVTALAHYQFEALHPFGDGNGRVGRLLIVLQMLANRSLPEPALTLSPWLLRRRAAYQDHLLDISKNGDWNAWICFFCEGLRAQCDSLVKGVDDLLRWSAEVRGQIHEQRWSGMILRLADGLIDWPMITVSLATQLYNVTQPAAQNAVDRLVQIGVLHETTGRNYGRIYGARGVIEIVERL